MKPVIIAVALAAAALPAWAQPAPPADAAATVITLSEHAEKRVPRDRLHAELRAEGVNADARQLKDEINRRMAAALDRAKAAPGVEVRTAGYSVYQERVGQGPATRWHGSQSLDLTGADFPALLALVGVLQGQGLALSNLSFDLSPAATKAVQDELTAAALAQLRERADRVAASLGSRVERYRELQIGNATTGPVMLRMAAAAGSASSNTPPVAEAGDATVSVNVEATIALAPVPR